MARTEMRWSMNLYLMTLPKKTNLRKLTTSIELETGCVWCAIITTMLSGKYVTDAINRVKNKICVRDLSCVKHQKKMETQISLLRNIFQSWHKRVRASKWILIDCLSLKYKTKTAGEFLMTTFLEPLKKMRICHWILLKIII